MSRAIITITIDADPEYTALHMSQPGRAGLGFDTGHDGTEMELAIDDLAAELKRIYHSELEGQA